MVAVVDAGGKGGLRWTSLVEMPVGRGTVLICQMRLVDKLQVEPVAQMVMENLLNYVTTRQASAKVGPVGVIAQDSRLADRLGALGFTVTAGEDAQVILVDAAQPGAGLEPPALRARLEEGATVVLHALTPDCLEQWQSLLLPGTSLQEVNGLHALANGEHELLEGISATDLWWSQVKRSGETGGIQVAYAVEGGEGAIELVAPGALVAMPVSQGLLVVDQMQWGREDVHQQRSGQYIALLLGNLLHQTPPEITPELGQGLTEH